MGGALTGGRRVFSSFKSTGAGPSDKPRCVIDLGRLLKNLHWAEESQTHLSRGPLSKAPLLYLRRSPDLCPVQSRRGALHKLCHTRFALTSLRIMLLFDGV